jgi:hypothetical protein
MRLRHVVIVACVVGAAAVGTAAAASLSLTTNMLGSGQAPQPACDSDGFTYTHTVDTTASHGVLTVTVSGINAACSGGTLKLTLANSSNGSIGTGSGAVTATGFVTLTITGLPASATVAKYQAAITN